MIELVYGPRATARLARSAHPDAPVVRPVESAPARTRSAAAALLRRAADRLAPDRQRIPA
jgi:hypothetical protein